MTATCWSVCSRVLGIVCAVSGIVACLTIGCGGNAGDGGNGGEPNQDPIINSLTANPTSVEPGGQSHLDCDATDADGDALQYSWARSAGAGFGTP